MNCLLVGFWVWFTSLEVLGKFCCDMGSLVWSRVFFCILSEVITKIATSGQKAVWLGRDADTARLSTIWANRRPRAKQSRGPAEIPGTAKRVWMAFVWCVHAMWCVT